MFEWDARKEAFNLQKHSVSFDEAKTAFIDVLGWDGEDIKHSLKEPRRLRLAQATSGKILVIAYTIRRQGNENITRIISARAASRRERKRYQKRGN